MKKTIALILIPSEIVNAHSATHHYLIQPGISMKYIRAFWFSPDKIAAAATAIFFKYAPVHLNSYRDCLKLPPFSLACFRNSSTFFSVSAKKNNTQQRLK
jgi:hypothetical protein